MTDFTHPALKELTDQQVRFAPAARRQEQVARAEQLLAEVDPGRVGQVGLVHPGRGHRPADRVDLRPVGPLADGPGEWLAHEVEIPPRIPRGSAAAHAEVG